MGRSGAIEGVCHSDGTESLKESRVHLGPHVSKDLATFADAVAKA